MNQLTVNIETKKQYDKKPGRPVKNELKGHKREYCKTINIAVDKAILAEVNSLALQARGLDLTAYVNTLITKDLEKNRKAYEQVVNVKNTFIE